MTEMSRPKPSMTFEGYIERIGFHFERLGVDVRPSQQEYVEAWNSQIPAKKMAHTFARRRRGALQRPNDISAEDPAPTAETLENRGGQTRSDETDKLEAAYGIVDGDVPWHESGKEDRPGFSLRAMGLEGYQQQVENRLRQYGYTGKPPSDRLLLDAFNAQTCAKGLARGFMRRNRKLGKL